MKVKNYFYLFSFVLIINACEKSQPSTVYKTLGTFSSAGKPNYLVGKDSISDTLQSFIDSILPPGQDIKVSHPELLSTNADIEIKQASDVYITFVSEGSGLTTSVGFYTYPTNSPPQNSKDIQVITYVFPSSGLNTPLETGDKVYIGRFEAGTSIGLVLLQGGWDITKSALNNNVAHFWTTDILNPEFDFNLKKHAILLNYTQGKKGLICFEDFDRTKPECDNDFNDQIVFFTINP